MRTISAIILICLVGQLAAEPVAAISLQETVASDALAPVEDDGYTSDQDIEASYQAGVQAGKDYPSSGLFFIGILGGFMTGLLGAIIFAESLPDIEPETIPEEADAVAYREGFQDVLAKRNKRAMLGGGAMGTLCAVLFIIVYRNGGM